MHRTTVLLLTLTSLPVLPAAALANPASLDSAPGNAASRIERFARVDERLYRGAQPDADDFQRLRDLGVRTIVSLRNEDVERRIVESLGMVYVHIPITLRPFGMSGVIPVSAIERFFQVIDDPASGVVFVHCRRGADRTGALVAMYRIARQQWTVDDAYREARQIGMRWWHYPVKNLLAEFAGKPPVVMGAGLMTAPAR